MSIRYGFFNAKRTDDGFDRLYSNEDMNDFLRGIINQNGIFTAVGEQCFVDYPVDIYPTSDYNSIVVGEGVSDVEPGSIMLRVKTGKAIVNGHWIIIDQDETVYLEKPDLGSAGRTDMISLRWNESTRKCSIVVTKGTGSIPQPEGFINGQFDPSNGVLDLALAYVYVPSGIPGPSTAGDIQITSNAGKDICPYISHLVLGPNVEDIDKVLSSYYGRFDKWFDEIEESKDLNLHISHRERTFNNIPKTIPLNSETFSDYNYDTSDLVQVYVNGMIVTEGTYYVIKSDSPDNWYVEIIADIFGEDDLVLDNNLTVNVIKASSLDLPPEYEDGDAVEY